VVEPWAAVICGLVSAPFVVFGDDLMDRLQIDDPAQVREEIVKTAVTGFIGLMKGWVLHFQMVC
jgi:ammonia channel protein AmtB